MEADIQQTSAEAGADDIYEDDPFELGEDVELVELGDDFVLDKEAGITVEELRRRLKEVQDPNWKSPTITHEQFVEQILSDPACRAEFDRLTPEFEALRKRLLRNLSSDKEFAEMLAGDYTELLPGE